MSYEHFTGVERRYGLRLDLLLDVIGFYVFGEPFGAFRPF